MTCTIKANPSVVPVAVVFLRRNNLLSIPDYLRPVSRDRESSKPEIQALSSFQNAGWHSKGHHLPLAKIVALPDAFFDCNLTERAINERFIAVAVHIDGPPHQTSDAIEKDREIDRILEEQLKIKSLRFPHDGYISREWLEEKKRILAEWVEPEQIGP
jgi:hypothetical protein